MSYLTFSQHAPRPELADRSDARLVADVSNGDDEAFAEFIERKGKGLLRFAMRSLGDREEAADVVQMVFLRVWQHCRRYDDRYSVNTWLYRIATNLVIDMLRARQTRYKHAEPIRHHLLRVVGPRPVAAQEELFRDEVLGILRDLTSNLTEKQRAAFLLKEVEGLTTEEVAGVLECRPSTVRNHLFSARKKLRDKVQARYPEYAQLYRERGSA